MHDFEALPIPDEPGATEKVNLVRGLLAAYADTDSDEFLIYQIKAAVA